MPVEGTSILVWVIACGILGVAFGYFFNTEGVKIIVGIWFAIGFVAFFMLAGLGGSELIRESIVGWVMFGISLGATYALVHYDSWLSPLLR